MIEQRDYQLDAIERCRREVARGRRRIILVAPTGSGKTVIASAIVAGAAEKGKRGLFLAHRRELVTQASRKLYDAGIDAGIVLPGFTPRPEQPIQVGSVQSLTARAIRSASLDLPMADLIVVDEAHHVRAESYRAILNQYPDAVLLGLSATPARADGRGLGTAFDCIVECPSVADLTRMQFLVPTRVFAPAPPDLEGVKVARGDYVESQLAERMDKPTLIGDVVVHWLRHAERRRTVVFATSISHSVHIRDEFARAGIAAEHLDGSTPIDERDDILARLTSGAIDVVTNCAVLTEGWDCPAVGCVVLARPTKSLGLYRQMCGRILRPHPGKADAIILDHAGSTWAHGFIDDDIAWSLRDDRRAENKAHASRGAHKAGALVSCPECDAARFQGHPDPAGGVHADRHMIKRLAVEGEQHALIPVYHSTPRPAAIQRAGLSFFDAPNGQERVNHPPRPSPCLITAAPIGPGAVIAVAKWNAAAPAVRVGAAPASARDLDSARRLLDSQTVNHRSSICGYGSGRQTQGSNQNQSC